LEEQDAEDATKDLTMTWSLTARTHTHTHTQQAKEIVSEQRKRQSSELQHNTKANRTHLETKKMEITKKSEQHHLLLLLK
jgi:hypothetical protein